MSKYRPVEVPEGYRCPLCPGHEDEDFFVWESLLADPICHGCIHDIFNALLLFPPVDLVDPEKIPSLEKLTGKPALELAILVVQEDIAELDHRDYREKQKQGYEGFPEGIVEEIKAQRQERLTDMRSILAELTELARKKR